MTTLPPFPAYMFPNNVLVRVSDDAIGNEGGANPAPAAGVTLPATVQDRGTVYDGDRCVSVASYSVSFMADPTPSLTRPLRAGDRIDWAGRTLTVLGPVMDRGGYGFLWRVYCESAQS